MREHVSFSWSSFSAAMRREDPLRSNHWEGIPNPLPNPPHAGRGDADTPAASCISINGRWRQERSDSVPEGDSNPVTRTRKKRHARACLFFLVLVQRRCTEQNGQELSARRMDERKAGGRICTVLPGKTNSIFILYMWYFIDKKKRRCYSKSNPLHAACTPGTMRR